MIHQQLEYSDSGMDSGFRGWLYSGHDHGLCYTEASLSITGSAKSPSSQPHGIGIRLSTTT